MWGTRICTWIFCLATITYMTWSTWYYNQTKRQKKIIIEYANKKRKRRRRTTTMTSSDNNNNNNNNQSLSVVAGVRSSRIVCRGTEKAHKNYIVWYFVWNVVLCAAHITYINDDRTNERTNENKSKHKTLDGHRQTIYVARSVGCVPNWLYSEHKTLVRACVCVYCALSFPLMLDLLLVFVDAWLLWLCGI